MEIVRDTLGWDLPRAAAPSVKPPAVTTVTSGLNAMAHAAEALYAQDRTVATDGLALEGLAAFVTGLPRVLANPQDLSARQDTQRGALTMKST